MGFCTSGCPSRAELTRGALASTHQDEPAGGCRKRQSMGSFPSMQGTRLHCVPVGLGPRQAPRPETQPRHHRLQGPGRLFFSPQHHARHSWAGVHHPPHALPMANPQQCIRASPIHSSASGNRASAMHLGEPRNSCESRRTHAVGLDDSFISSSPLAMHESTFVKNCLKTRRSSHAALERPKR